jgi:hypothetical protein
MDNFKYHSTSRETTLTLNAPVDWEVGNEIVVAPTRYNGRSNPPYTPVIIMT